MLVGVAALAAPGDFEPAWGGFESFFRSLMKEQGVVGGAVWVFHDGKPVAHTFHGLADIDQNRAVDENTIFHWASVTKTLTGIAILQLRDRGLVSLDDPVVKYLPELRGPRPLR